MTADRREDALDWGDPDDPSWVDPGRDDRVDAEEPAPGDEGADARDGAAAPVATAASPADRRRTAVTAATGLLAGVYLAYSVGWILSILFSQQVPGATVLVEIMNQFGEFLAIIACALWFGTVMALTRGGRPAVRIGWLALGTLVLLPWPLLIGLIR